MDYETTTYESDAMYRATLLARNECPDCHYSVDHCACVEIPEGSGQWYPVEIAQD